VRSARAAALVVVLASGVVAAVPAQASGPLGPCKDGAYKLSSSRWTTPMRWWFRASSTPKGVSRGDAEAAVRRAALNIVTGHNSCGLPDRISATEHYLGRTRTPTDVNGDSTCGKPDGKSVIGFGALNPLDMAITCWWTSGGRTVEADIKLNKANYAWVTRIRPGCALAWSVEAVATHEFGHAFGLAHVTEGLHGHLTMSPLIAPCQSSESTLGLGDVRGLERTY
jgi:hypothetical protein